MPRPRFTLALMMMLVGTAASAAALGARLDRLWLQNGIWVRGDLVALVIVAISATGMVLARWSQHSAAQTMLQINVACLTLLVLVRAIELRRGLFIILWFPATFTIVLVAPLVAIEVMQAARVKTPRRTWWIKTAEAVMCAAITLFAVGLELSTVVLVVSILF